MGHVTTQFLYQGQLLEKAIRDLEETRRDLVKYKEAFHDAEREKCDLEGRVKVLSEEIRQFRERGTHGREEGVEQRDPLTQGETLFQKDHRQVFAIPLLQMVSLCGCANDHALLPSI